MFTYRYNNDDDTDEVRAKDQHPFDSSWPDVTVLWNCLVWLFDVGLERVGVTAG